MVNNIGSSPTPITSYIESPAFQSLPTTIKDTLLRSFSEEELNAQFVFNPSNAPVLVSPSTQFSNSMDDFFKTLSGAKVNLSQQFSKSDFIDQVTRKKASQLAGLMASFLADRFTALDVKIADNKAQSQLVVNELQALVNNMALQTNAQNALIVGLTSGNADEKAKTSALITAYTNYTNALAANGITSTGNGNYNVPAGKESIFNSLTATYKTAVNTYNTFRSSIYNTLNSYNASTNTYNTNATANNTNIALYINEYELQPILNEQGITTPNQPTALTRDATGYASAQLTASPISSPGSVFIYPPSTFIQTIASNGAPVIPGFAPQFPINVAPLLPTIIDKKYEVNVKPLADEVAAEVAYWSYLNALRVFDPVQDYTPDPLLNNKLITKRLAPTFIDATQPVQENSSSGGGGQLSILSIGLGTPHINAMLGKGALTQAIQNLNLGINYEQLQELTNELLLLSVGLIGTNGGEALLPSLGLITSLLTSLPKDSPVFSLLFAISFANRTQEGIAAGLTAEALKAFAQGNPLLQNLSDADLAALTAALNVGLLLISSKLIESSLGLPGLTAQLTLPLLPSDLSSGVIDQANSESKQASDEFFNQLNDYFVSKGYPTEEADFLSKLGTQLANEDFGGPSASSVSLSSSNASSSSYTSSSNVSSSYTSSSNVSVSSSSSISTPSVSRSSYSVTDLSDSNNTDNTQSVASDGPTGDPELDAYLEANPYSSYSPINQQVLTDSIKASLILSEGREFSLAKANLIAREAVKRTFEDNEGATTPAQFRVNLESNLRDLGVRSSLSAEVASNAVIIPPKNESLKPEQLKNSTDATTPTFKPISERDIASVFESRILELLAPRLGAKLIKLITEELAKTLFGNPHPDSRDIAQVKSPTSLVNQVKDQLYHLDIKHNREYAKAWLESVKESLIISTDLNAFLEKLMEPLAALIHVGPMYSQPPNAKKSIDIIV
ncbi:MAG: hypothetical protein H0V82_12185 [Candidatus Protochlamydia sp.]|nr:hypothetical protein [Candidatus Protochlamydia sp.]